MTGEEQFKELYRRYIHREGAAELEDFRVRFTGAVLFLDYVHKIGGRWITGADCEIERWRRSK